MEKKLISGRGRGNSPGFFRLLFLCLPEKRQPPPRSATHGKKSTTPDGCLRQRSSGARNCTPIAGGKQPLRGKASGVGSRGTFCWESSDENRLVPCRSVAIGRRVLRICAPQTTGRGNLPHPVVFPERPIVFGGKTSRSRLPPAGGIAQTGPFGPGIIPGNSGPGWLPRRHPVGNSLEIAVSSDPPSARFSRGEQPADGIRGRIDRYRPRNLLFE